MASLILSGVLVLLLTDTLQIEGQYTCHCKTSCPDGIQKSPTQPCTEGCQPGFYDKYCQTKNVALRKKAWQVSTYSHYIYRLGKLVKKWIPSTPDRAVDGNTNGFYSRRSCTHTGLNETAPYWTVNLGQVYPVYKIIIYQRTTLRERLTGFEVRVDDKLCYRWQSEEAPPIRIPLNCQQPIKGQNVTVRLPEREDSRYQILTLCEVLVLVCNDYWFGERCDKTCHCRNQEKCDTFTGYCKNGCASGFMGDNCQQYCPDGTWGEDCRSTCGHCRGGIPCIPQTGECVSFGCDPGWEGPLCDKRIGQNPPEPIGRGTPPSPASTRPEDGNNLSSGDITAIFFGILIATLIVASSVLVYRRWRQKTESSRDNRYDDLVRRPATTEHIYVGVSHVSQATASGDAVDGDKAAKFTCSDDHYEYIAGCDGYLEPISEPTK